MASRALIIALCFAPLGACDSKANNKPDAPPPPSAAAPPAQPSDLKKPAPADPKKPAPASPAPETTPVTIGSEKFTIEVALDDSVRLKGLGGRTALAARGGMLFVFPFSAELSFVMRDCVIPIDIVFLDGAGRVLAKHTMATEPPRAENESPQAYEARLKKYSSRYPAQFALEVAAGTLDTLGVKVGDLIRFDAEGLKRRAR